MLDISELARDAHLKWFAEMEEQMVKHDWAFVRLMVSNDTCYFPRRPMGKIVETVDRYNLSGAQLSPKTWEHPWRFIRASKQSGIYLYRQDPRLPKRKLQYRAVTHNGGGGWTDSGMDAGFAVRDYKSGNMDPCGNTWPNGEDDPRFKQKRMTQRGRRKIWLRTLETFCEFTG